MTTTTNKAVKELHLDEPTAKTLTGFIRRVRLDISDDDTRGEIETLLGRLRNREPGQGKELHLRWPTVVALDAAIDKYSGKEKARVKETLESVRHRLGRGNRYVPDAETGRRHTIREDLVAAKKGA